MTVELTELQDSARRVVNDAGLAAAEETLWSQVIELGWLMVAIPEAMGGLDAGVSGTCTMLAELGRGLSTAPYLPAMLAVDAVCHSDIGGRDQWLERMLGGELITASLSESHVVSDGSRLSGTLTGVQSAASASHVLLWTAARDAVFLVALQQAGVDVLVRPTWDQTRRLYDVQLTDVPASQQVLLAEGSAAAVMIRRLLALRDLASAADAIGGANALLALTIEHLQTRKQFKRPLAMFQALKHRCADLKAAIVSAEALLQDTLRQLEDELSTEEAGIKAKGAKLFATSMFARVVEDSLQLHGGIGMADEHPCHLFLKRALLSEQLGVSGNACAMEIAGSLLASGASR